MRPLFPALLVPMLALAACSAAAIGPAGIDPTGPRSVARAGATGAQPCVGTDPNVRVPGAPHGLYVWNPYRVDGGKYENALEQHAIGKDKTLCGVSLVIAWSTIEPRKGDFRWGRIFEEAKPYDSAGLSVNLLFAAGPERGSKNSVTPAWVTAPTSSGGDGVPIVQCDAQPPAPDYLSPRFERDWFAAIAAAVKKFSGQRSVVAAHVGYMRFAIGFGVEAIPAHFDNGAHADCLAKWEAPPVDFTYQKWVRHSLRVVDALGAQSTDKQLMVALNYLGGGSSIYSYPNAVAREAAAKHVAFGTENLGISNVATPSSTPKACDPHANIENLYWCQAFTRHVGQVPFEFQTIVASTAPQPGVSAIDLGKALQYGMANHAQIFELYPQEWMAADVPGFVSATSRAAHQLALSKAAAVLGAQASSGSLPRIP